MSVVFNAKQITFGIQMEFHAYPIAQKIIFQIYQQRLVNLVFLIVKYAHQNSFQLAIYATKIILKMRLLKNVNKAVLYLILKI